MIYIYIYIHIYIYIYEPKPGLIKHACYLYILLFMYYLLFFYTCMSCIDTFDYYIKCMFIIKCSCFAC